MELSKIQLIEKIAPPSALFDIQTGTHNFFANGVLVHNSELAFGLDADGKLYTTRGAKGQKGIHYDTAEYLHGGGGPTFAAAHEALTKITDKIAKVMHPGEAVEIEVVYGRQPNAVVYGLDGMNYITFLRPIEGTEEIELRADLCDKLAAALKDEKVTITSKFPTSTDGISLTKESVTSTWKFTEAPKIDPAKLKQADVKKEIDSLRKFLTDQNSVATDAGLALSNFEVSTINLTNVPSEVRPAIKKERDQVNVKILSDFKLPIKEKLLQNFNRSVKSRLQGEVKSGEVDGIEGVVFVDPETNEVFKLVDKDTFTSINQFNYQIRKKLFSVVRTTDQDASLEARGGIVGVLKYRIMSLLGIPEAARGFNLKKILGDLDGESPEDTLNKFAEGYAHINDDAYRQKISAMIKATIEEVNDTLEDFKKNNGDYKLELKNGKTIGYTDEIVKRTLLTFAEVRQHLEQYKTKIDKTRNTKELLAAIIGNVAEKIHENSLMTESVKVSRLKKDATIKHLKHYTEASLSKVLHSYVYNYLAAVILCKLKDKEGMQELRDHKGGALKRMLESTSYINQLGCLVFFPEEHAQYLQKSVIKQLQKHTSKITVERRKKIHSQISSSQNYRMHYDQVSTNLYIMDLRFDLNDKLLHEAIKTLKHWKTASIDDKNHLMSKAFYKLQAVDEHSPYLVRLRHAIEHFLKNPHKENKMLIKEIMQLTEDEGGDGVTPPVAGNSACATATQSADIAAVPYRLFKGKLIRRIPRKIEKRKKFAKKKAAITANITANK